MPAQKRPLIPFSTDMKDHDVTAEGISDFFWPITNKEITALGYALMFRLADILRDYEDNHPQALVCKMATKYYVAQLCGVFQAQRVQRGLLDAGYAPRTPQDWHIYPYLFAGKEPSFPAYVTGLLRRKKKQNVFIQQLKNPARLWKNLKKLSLFEKNVKLDELHIVPITQEVVRDNIVVTQRTSIINAHAAMLPEEKVVYARSDRWFSSIDDEELEDARAGIDKDIANAFLETTKTLFEEKGGVFDTMIETHARRVLEELVAPLTIHLERLLKRDDIPRRLWTGTAGIIWDLLLRSAVRIKGGETTGHDHGGGTAHASKPIIGYLELWGCDYFYTFNDHQAALIESHKEKWPRLDKTQPVVKGVTDAKIKVPEIKPGTKEIKRVVVMSTLYDGDRPRIVAFTPDITYTDWQARLLSKLKSWGYKIAFKPHPESDFPPHPALSEKLGANIVHGLFEDLKEQADLIILDYTHTSVMLPALLSDIPLLLVDYDGIDWYPEAKELFQKRCPVVDAAYDDTNRVSVNWDAVRKGIEEAAEKTGNREFVEKFLL